MDHTSLVVTQTEEYISFVFDEDSLSTLEYKVLMNLEKGDFLPAYLMKQNGRRQLLYVIPGASHTLESVGYSLEPKLLFYVIDAIDRLCMEIENNGFLKTEHLDMNLKHMVLDTNSGKLQMIYLPVSSNATVMLNKDSALRELAKELVSHNVNLKVSTRIQQLHADLMDNRISFTVILEKIRTGAYERETYFDEKGTIVVKQQTGGVRKIPYLVVLENQMRLEINRPEYVLGKNRDMADGVIYNHTTVSRKHCRVIEEKGHYYIQDLGSKNGTYVNDRYLMGDEKVELHNGDRVRLAECDLIFYAG
ncbi:MAG: FHA domain-containing protein [Lachnospiraceae bacterium]|nr:FHA domain-containing protein [Lachnospiraceae bacterium]